MAADFVTLHDIVAELWASEPQGAPLIAGPDEFKGLGPSAKLI